jgi:A/G-specific adenine glycosylase
MPRRKDEMADISTLRKQLISWYDENQRDLPWRADKDPYAIWVSEIMLQQTRVAVVVDRYQKFMHCFPTLAALAQAHEQEVLALWSGLGYYRRARMLHKAAQFVMDNLSGVLPASSAELRKLPGIGSYTAAAIASIAHGEAIAMMELGATVCLPRNPQCLVCPISMHCETRGEHKTTPRPRMLSREVAHALSVRTSTRPGKARATASREVLLEQRPSSQTVMPEMWELPKLRNAEVPEEDLRMSVRHAIMQVNYYVRIRTVFEDDVDVLTLPAGQRRWVPLGEAAAMALTGLTRKVLTRAHLLPSAPLDTIAPRTVRELL